MVANVTGLTPSEKSVIDLFNRLRDADLPDPTLRSVCEFTGLKEPMAKLSCERLVQKGLLVHGGATKRSYRIPKDLKTTA